LLAHAPDIIVTYFVEPLLVLSVDGLALAEDLRVRCNDAVLSGIRLDNLELNSTHPTSRKESVAFTDGTVGLKEVWLQVHVKQVTADALNRVTEREHVDPLSILHVSALRSKERGLRGQYDAR
jgi:hypothetical protein